MATILISSEPGKFKDVAKEIAKIKGVKKSFAVLGRYDVVVFAETVSLKELSDLRERIVSLPGVKRIETLVELGAAPISPRRITDPVASYHFVMSLSPYLLEGVSESKWIAFLNMLEAKHIRYGESAPSDVLSEVSKELQLTADQVSKINCTKKCLELYDRDGVAFPACIEYCLRTGDP